MNLELSPIDKLFIGPHGYPIEMSFYFSSRLDPLFLQAALDRLAEKWPWLRAQLKMDSQTAWLESAAHPLSIRVQEVDFIAAPDDVTKFASLRTDIQTTTGRPLIEVHLTLGENSSWLTVGMAHFFGDGYSYFLFLKNLSLVAMKQEPMAIQWDRSSIKQTASNTTSSTAISEGEAPNRP